MSLLAEVIVEEWLNRKGFFTIRGIRIGVHEIDLLAIGFNHTEPICRHIEVTASIRPIGYICSLSKETQKMTGRGPQNAKKRSSLEISSGVEEWIFKKYFLPEKKQLREDLYQGNWQYELVVHQVKYEEELKEIEKHGIMIHRMNDIISELSSLKTIIRGASGSDLLDLVLLGKNKT